MTLFTVLSVKVTEWVWNTLPYRYPLAVTRHKDSEATSSSIYTQNNPWEPEVSFEDYIRNNEDIVNQVQSRCIYIPCLYTSFFQNGELLFWPKKPSIEISKIYYFNCLVESFKSKTIFTTQDINENWQQVQITFKNHWGKMDPETYLIL